MIARIGRTLSRNRQLAGFIFRGDTPRMGSGPCTATASENGAKTSGAVSALRALVEHVVFWDRRVRARQMLASLDDRMLRDIGIDRATAESDSTTSFWRWR
jgi:uncharacterized protein YjiS (DUF1127 family)